MPPIWGPAHGQWVGAIFLPIWLFMDSIIAQRGPRRSGDDDRGGRGRRLHARVRGVLRQARATVWRTAACATRMSVDEYVRRERVWAIASVPVAAALIGWALWFHLVFEAAARPLDARFVVSHHVRGVCSHVALTA